MEIINITNNNLYLREYITLCLLEWSPNKHKNDMDSYIERKIDNITNGDRVITVLGLIDNSKLIGFISLFKYDGDLHKELTPWYATMYVKKEYRNKGYSRILNDSIIEEARRLGYSKLYLKTDLVNYYEKFNAKFIEYMDNGEKLYYIDL